MPVNLRLRWYRAVATIASSIGSAVATGLSAAVGSGAGSAPAITSPSFLVAGTVDTLYPTTTFTATGSTPITWTSTALPAGMTFTTVNNQGVLAGTPTATSSGSITFTATNALGSDGRALTLTVGAAGAGTAPFNLSNSLGTAVAGSLYSVSLSAQGAPSTFTWASIGSALPGWLTLVSNGTLSGTPPSTTTLTGLQFSCTNTAGTTNTGILSLPIVAAGSIPPEIKTDLLPIAVIGQPYTAALKSTGGATTTWSIADGFTYGTAIEYGSSLPNGLTLDASTGVISGTPTSGAVTVEGYTVRATNAYGHDEKINIRIEILSNPYSKPIITNSLGQPQSPPCAVLGVPYSYKLAYASTDTGPVTWAITAGTLPAGLSFDTATGTINGTPTAISSNFTGADITVTATNNGGTSDASAITVTVVSAVLTTSLPTATAGASYRYKLLSPSEQPVTWAVSPALPSGLALDTSTGIISGTPAGAMASANYTFTATVNSVVSTQVIPLAVNAATGSAIANLTIQVGPGTGVPQGTYITLDKFTAMTTWVDGAYSQEFWRCNNVVDDISFIATKETGASRYELWMYREPKRYRRGTLNDPWPYYGPSGNILRLESCSDRYYDVQISASGAPVTPQFSSGATTRVLCATGTVRRLATDFKAWDWARINSLISSYKVPGYDTDYIGYMFASSIVNGNPDGIKTSAGLVNHNLLGGRASSYWYDGVRSGQGGAYISSRAVNHSWEARAISELKKGITTNLTNLLNQMRVAAEYSGVFPQWVNLDPQNFKPYDPQVGTNRWMTIGGVIGNGGETRQNTFFVPQRPEYPSQVTHMYNNGHIAFQATRDPYYLMLLQNNSHVALSQLVAGLQIAYAKQVDPNIVNTAYWANGAPIGDLPFYLLTAIQYRAFAWGSKEILKSWIARQSCGVAADFLQPIAVYDKMLTDIANQWTAQQAPQEAVSITTTNQAEIPNAARKILNIRDWTFEQKYTLGTYQSDYTSTTNQTPWALYGSSFTSVYPLAAFTYALAAGRTEFRPLLEKQVLEITDRINYIGGDRLTTIPANVGASVPQAPTDSSGLYVAPVPYSNMAGFVTYWLPRWEAFRNADNTKFAGPGSNLAGYEFCINAMAVHQLNQLGVFSPPIQVSDVSNANSNSLTTFNNQTAKTTDSGGVHTGYAFKWN